MALFSRILREAEKFVAGKLPISFPRDVGTLPAYYNYLKGSRPIDAGVVGNDGSLLFGHQVLKLFVDHSEVISSPTLIVRPQ